MNKAVRVIVGVIALGAMAAPAFAASSSHVLSNARGGAGMGGGIIIPPLSRGGAGMGGGIIIPPVI